MGKSDCAMAESDKVLDKVFDKVFDKEFCIDVSKTNPTFLGDGITTEVMHKKKLAKVLASVTVMLDEF